MEVTEVESFVLKFKQLWKAGHSAHLDLDTHAGDAWVGLRVRLGQEPGLLHQIQHPRKTWDGPSRQRRRARRAAARQQEAEEAIHENETEEGIDENSAEAEEANTDQVVKEAKENEEEKAAATAEIEEETSKFDDRATENVAVDDEFCPDENYYPEIDGTSALTCFQCNIEYFPENYKQGDEITKHILCRRHIGVSKCEKCGENMIGLGTLRVHRQTCMAPSWWGRCPPTRWHQFLFSVKEAYIFF